MSGPSGKGGFPGWEYIKEYAPAINLVLETYPGIATALMEAQRAYKEATEVPFSVVLREYPAEEEQLEYFVKKYGLQRPKTGAMLDAVTQIGRPRRPAETQTALEQRTQGSQTELAESPDVSPPPAMVIHPRPPIPSLSTETQTPWKFHVDPSPPSPHSRSYYEEESPILRENFVKGHRPVNDAPQEQREIPSLLGLKIERPARVSMRTLQYLEETAHRGCWNCGKGRHCFSECEARLRVFCFACGEPGFIKKDMPLL